MQLPECPIELTLSLLKGKWKVLILLHLMQHAMRFEELKKKIGHISQKVLTEQLRELENVKSITRAIYPEIPPKVEYRLTDIGYSLQPLFDEMIKWGTNYKESYHLKK